MLIDSININALRIFEQVYVKKSMTKAAKTLGMTQSGVSQHIKNLEDILEVPLFDRIKHRPLPTRQADALVKACQDHFQGIEDVLQEITHKKATLKGIISIGLPLEFGNNFVLPILSKLGGYHPKINFNIKYGHATEMIPLILAGEIDFAFLDSFSVDSQIKTRPIWDETLSLCCSKNYYNEISKSLGQLRHEISYYEKIDFVDYIEGAPVLKMWFSHHLNQSFAPNIRASLMDVQGMSRVISEGLGAGILPHHVVSRLKGQGHHLFIFPGKGIHLHNTISMAYLQDRSQTKALEMIQKELLRELKNTLPNF